MSQWFILVIVLIFTSSITAILVRIEGRNKNERIESGELSADDFDIVE